MKTLSKNFVAVKWARASGAGPSAATQRHILSLVLNTQMSL